MDVITETSLEALIQRATDPRNKNLDTAAIEAFCGIIKKAPDGSLVASKLIATKIQSSQEWEALQGLSVLEECMKNCGPSFHAEIGKFRFLNEMIKLVSPKFLGERTPPAVRNQVLKLMYSWTMHYPKEPKIKEAFEMLKKQGVINKDDPLPVEEAKPALPSKANPLFQDEEKVSLLQKLLHSKNPDDLQAANRLIKTMVKEDERRVEVKSKRLTELETVKNNVRLLSEMLDSYKPGQASSEEMDLIKELHQGCERLRPNVFRLAAETQDNEEMLNQVLNVSDELGHVFDKYTTIIVLGKKMENVINTSTDGSQVSSLLDLSTPIEESSSIGSVMQSNADILSDSMSILGLNLVVTSDTTLPDVPLTKHFDALSDIFASLNAQNSVSSTSFLEPTSVTMSPQSESITKEKNSKLKAFEDLDVLGETLLQQYKMDALISSSQSSGDQETQECAKAEGSVNGDDVMVDLLDEDSLTAVGPVAEPPAAPPAEPQVSRDTPVEVKPLTDIAVSLETIKPSSIPPVVVIDEKNGVTVTLHVAKDSPRADVTVIVVTTISKNTQPVSNYLFQAVVPKGCKLKLQPPSGSSLPAHNPFLPPSAITQIMLIANPQKVPVTLKCIVSYTMDDETVTEMGEVESLPMST